MNCIQALRTRPSMMTNAPYSGHRHRRKQKVDFNTRKAAKQFLRILISTLSKAMLHTDLIADLKYKPQECGWDEVLECIDIAKASYDEKGKKSKVRAWSRNADTTAGFLESLAGIIPDEKGLSVLRQGLVIIFQASHPTPCHRAVQCVIPADRVQGMANAYQKQGRDPPAA